MKMANAEQWTTKNGSKWKTMPEVMIQYRAASFFGRMNCPDMIMGIYSADEAAEMAEIPSDGFAIIADPETGEVKEIEPPKDEPITQEQRQELFKMAKAVYDTDANNKIKELIAEEGYDSTAKVLTSAYNRIIEKIQRDASTKGDTSAGDVSQENKSDNVPHTGVKQ